MGASVVPIWRDAPRWAPDWPLPPYGYIPGAGLPHPARHVDGHSRGWGREPAYARPEDWRRNEAYLYGVDCYHWGYPWEAHEAWEGCWRLAARDSVEWAFYQGLILNSAAQLNVRTNSPRGVAAQSRLAVERLKRVAEARGTFMGLDVARFLVAMETCYGPVWAGNPLSNLGPAPRILLVEREG